MMNEKNLSKLNEAKKALENYNLIYRELPNGQLQVDKANFWSTKEKWFCPITNTKGVGINSFINHVLNR